MTAYLICESANFHGGDPTQLLKLVELLAGRQYPRRRGFKFHPISADALARPSFPAYPVYERLGIDSGHWRKIIAETAQNFDVWLEMADAHCVSVLAENTDLVIGLKLQASMLENQEVLGLLKTMDISGKQLIANVSGFEISQIELLLDQLGEVGFRGDQMTLQVGFQSYPTAIEDSQLNKLAVLAAAFPQYRLGMADHVDATNPYALVLPAIAASLGCSLVEKHVCIARSQTEFDAFSALEPDEFMTMQDHLVAAAGSFSSTFISSAEISYLEKSRLLPCSAREKRLGSLVSPHDVIYRRQGGRPLPMAEIRRLQQDFHVLAAAHQKGDAFSETSFRKARIGVVVACRMKSSRLRDKALLPLAGKAMIDRCIENCQRMRYSDTVVLATSTVEQDAVLEAAATRTGCGFYRGDPDDVMSRYLGVADMYGLDVIVRVTGDNPVISPEIADYLLEEHFRAGADFTRAENDAIGTGAHIINVDAMRRVIDGMGSAPMSEYMNWYFENNSEAFNVQILSLPDDLSRSYRLTMDYDEDYKLMSGLFDLLAEANLPHTTTNVFKVLDANPKLARLNAGLTVKYHTNQALIAQLQKETRLPLVIDADQPIRRYYGMSDNN